MRCSRRVFAAFLCTFVLVALAPACVTPRQPTSGNAAPSRDQPPEATQASSDGACRFDVSGDKEETVYFVLGSLDEYLGRVIVEGDDRVEGFYGTESDRAAVFVRQLRKLAAEQGFDAAIARTRDESGGISLHSTPIAGRINSCYRYQMTGGTWIDAADGSRRRMTHASLGISLFLKSGRSSSNGPGLSDEVFHRRRALAYLAGAWARYRRGDDLAFANAKDKATLVAQLLVNLGCRPVRLETTFGYVPQSNIVRFTPTDEVRAWLGRSW